MPSSPMVPRMGKIRDCRCGFSFIAFHAADLRGDDEIADFSCTEVAGWNW